MNHWIFTATPHKGDGYSLSSQDIYNTRMADRFWGFNLTTPNLRKLRPGDKVVFYLGRPKKAFAGTATLGTAATELTDEQKEHYSHGISFYRPDVGVFVEDIDIWPASKHVESMLDELAFVRNKESWQSHFQGGVTAISAEDYDAILSSQVMEAASGGDWSEEEVRETVRDYFEMLSRELRGEQYSKTEYRKVLLGRLDGRSKGAVEFKHQNISAVLVSRDMPYIDGYKPRSNYQAILEDAVDQYLEANPDILELIKAETEDPPNNEPKPVDFSNVVEDAPEPVDESGEGRKRAYKPRKYDYAKREAQNRKLGSLGERFVVSFERDRLTKAGRDDLAAKVEQISETKGDGAGHDVLSFEEDGTKRYIEVKTSNFGKNFPFGVTANELAFSDDYSEQYYLYRVFNFRKSPRLFMINGSLRRFNPTPTSFKITF